MSDRKTKKIKKPIKIRRGNYSQIGPPPPGTPPRVAVKTVPKNIEDIAARAYQAFHDQRYAQAALLLPRAATLYEEYNPGRAIILRDFAAEAELLKDLQPSGGGASGSSILERAKNALGGGGGAPGGGAPEDKLPEIKAVELKRIGDKVMDFAALAGLDREKALITDEFILPNDFQGLLKPSTRLLMYGPAGTGKTMLAQALTGEFRVRLNSENINMVVASGAEIKGKYLGETEKNLKNLFAGSQDIAEKTNDPHARTLLFFDEIEAIAGKRGSDPSMTNSVNALLQLLEGAGKDYNRVIFIGATNLPFSLAGAIMRRFKTRIFVDLPNANGRRALITMRFLERTQNLCANRNGSTCSKLIRLLTEKSGWMPGQLDSMLQALKDKGVEPGKASEFFQRAGRDLDDSELCTAEDLPEDDPDAILNQLCTISDDGFHPVGLSFSDLDDFLRQAFNRLGFLKLRSKGAVKQDCCVLPSSESCDLCGLSPEERKEIRLTLKDLKENDQVFIEELQKYRPTTNMSDYLDLLVYAIDNRGPGESK